MTPPGTDVPDPDTGVPLGEAGRVLPTTRTPRRSHLIVAAGAIFLGSFGL
jgi:hypothetical protein